ncbi:unnamed protein product [Urochloa decumbens]|uniref:Protein kinase domain-containing protein n=1 Tax=Urochloa decumbens TaxID=240449 RepID=A0ABC8YGC6_9POAL
MSSALFPLAALLLAALAAAAEPECLTKCGNVDIPYPFGIGARCSRGKGFEIACVDNGSTAVLPSVSKQRIPVMNLSVAPPAVKVMLPVAYRCYNSTGATISLFEGQVDVNSHGVYRISDARNRFVVLGCNSEAFTQNSPRKGRGRYDYYSYYAGCVTYCLDSRSAQDGRCASVGCCQVDIPPGLTDNVVSFQDWPHNDMEWSPCDYAFLVEKGHYTFRVSDLHMDGSRSSMPVWLDWAIRDNGSLSCAAAKNRTGYACISAHSECVDSVNGSGYFCRCKKGFEGNPYQAKNGCTNINECIRPKDYPCYGICKDTEGSYICKCRPGYRTISGDPTKEQCIPKFPLEARLALGVGISLGMFVSAVALLLIVMIFHKRRMNEFFKKNGGSVLQKLENIKIFTKDELKKITKNNSHVLGKGGFGQVYKGTLEDDTVVAVKASIEVNEARKEDFTNEVIIQSQMIHKNIIKLLGCCLEVDVPMLVYEFAANGNLHDVLHDEASRQLPLSLDLRLDIAIESAEGLTYMHSSTNRTIRHGDVKPANILLDSNFVPKISDFGTSKLLTVDKDFTMFVVGSMGYIDPVFHKTGHLTQKSDVYSFGVVLLELICRKPTIYDESCSLIIEFQRVYEQENSGSAMFDKDIAVTEEDVLVLEEIGWLAMECLKEKVEDRPDMKEVAERLMMLRRARKHGIDGASGVRVTSRRSASMEL